jgi:hypothetical protein
MFSVRSRSLRWASFSLTALLISPSFAVSNDIGTLAGQGCIAVKAVGTGRHMGESVLVTVTNRTPSPLDVVIPAGWNFDSENEGTQNVMNVRTEAFVVPAGSSTTVSCRAFCSETEKQGPGQGAVFNLGAMASPKLVELAKFIDRGDFPDDAVLFSVWVVTGARPFSSIKSDDMAAIEPLRNEVAWLIGMSKNKPEPAQPVSQTRLPAVAIMPEG